MEAVLEQPKVEHKILDVTEKQSCVYAIPLWLRDEQIKLAITRIKRRIGDDIPPGTHYPLRNEPIAVVCFGPSLNDTWEQVRDFKNIITCSGAHKFLVERGIRPTFDCEVDPRKHKALLLGPPHKDVTYLIASTCHPKLFDHLEGYNVVLWHIFASEEEAQRILPRGEWALTGGSSAGLRAMALARFLGFTDLHVFGMDGNFGKSGKHAAEHPNQPPGHSITNYEGKEYHTTPSVLHCATETFHELDSMSDVRATFYGEGLVQAMAKNYVPKYKGKMVLAFNRPELISPEYKELNAKLHRDNPQYGVGGDKHAETVVKLAESIMESTKKKFVSVLDFGCGKGRLAQSLPFPIAEYDPAIPGKEQSPKPADLVVATDVLEHIEPDKLKFVLDDLKRCVKQVGYFVIATVKSGKEYANGKNTHLIQQGEEWWTKQLSKFFEVGKVQNVEKRLHVIVGPRKEVPAGEAKSAFKPTIIEVKKGETVAKFYSLNDVTKWRAETLLKKEPVTIEWIESMKSGETFFDVGANIGGYSVWAGKLGMKVFAFEPEAENYSLLIKNLNLNGLTPQAFCMALTDHEHAGMLRITQPIVGGSCATFQESVPTGQTQACFGIPIDSLVERGCFPPPDHIKIDVDGSEYKVVKGAEKVIRNGLQSLLVEVNTNSKDHLEMVESLQKMGFAYDQAQVDRAIRKDGFFKGCAEYLFRKVSPLQKHLRERIGSVTVCNSPSPYIYVENVFPEEFYAEMLKKLPKKWLPIEKSRKLKHYPQRFTAPQDPFWTDLSQKLTSGFLRKLLCEKFELGSEGLKEETLLIRDKPGYKIGPHTDHQDKVISALFYLPKDESQLAAGTSMYESLTGFTCVGGPHYDFKDFKKVVTMPFKPNSLFAFWKTDRSFHGVEKWSGPGNRDVLLYDIRRPKIN